MLPASQSTDLSQLGVNHLQPGAITLTPDHPFVVGGSDLAPFQNDVTSVIKKQLSVVQAATITLVDSEQHVHVVLTSCCCNGLGGGSWNSDSLVVQREVRAAHQDRRLDK